VARDLFIHIGLPKTGSTALQTFFARNRERLLEKSIDYLPIGNFAEARAGQVASGNGALLARAMLPEKDEAYLPWSQERVSGAFKAAVARSNAGSILLSSELFALAGMPAWSNVLSFCRELDLSVTLLAVVRNQCDWISSTQLQTIKRHRQTRISEESIRRVYPQTKFLNYHSYFSALSPLVGGRIGFVSYDKVSSKGLIPALMGRIGITDLSSFTIDNTPINITPSPEEIAFLQLCNQFNPDQPFSDVLAAPLNGLDRSAPPARWTIISPALQQTIQASFADENRNLLKSFNLPDDFFGQPCANYVDLQSVSISVPTLSILLARYLTSYDRRIRALAHEIASLKRMDGKG
jgi:hypothetical protein